MSPIVTHALEFGVVLSVILFVLLLVVLRANAEIMLNDYPPDIKALCRYRLDHSSRRPMKHAHNGPSADTAAAASMGPSEA